jgi:thioredoxin reductase (NADPH)
MCIVGAQHHIRVGPVLNQSYGLLRAAFDGIFAIGDVRSGSIKRVAAAVGEGAQVVATLHATLASMKSKIPGEPAAQRG